MNRPLESKGRNISGEEISNCATPKFHIFVGGFHPISVDLRRLKRSGCQMKMSCLERMMMGWEIPYNATFAVVQAPWSRG